MLSAAAGIRLSRWGSAFRRPPDRFLGVSRTALLVAGGGQLFALVLLLSTWERLDRPAAGLLLWLVLSAVVPGVVLSAARSGGWPGPAVAALGWSVLVVVDLAVPALVPPGERFGIAGWNWGAVALVLLALSGYVPTAHVVVGAAAHATAAVGWGLAGSESAGMPAVAVILTLATCLAAPLSAVWFMRDYGQVVAVRQAAAARRQELATREQAQESVRREVEDRLRTLRSRLAPLLEDVACGRAVPLDVEGRRLARSLADGLRRDLTEDPALTWLLPASVRARLPVTVRGARPDPDELTTASRTRLEALVTAVLDRDGWERATIALHPRAGGGAALGVESYQCTVICHGPAAVTRLAAEVLPLATLSGGPPGRVDVHPQEQVLTLELALPTRGPLPWNTETEPR